MQSDLQNSFINSSFQLTNKKREEERATKNKATSVSFEHNSSQSFPVKNTPFFIVSAKTTEEMILTKESIIAQFGRSKFGFIIGRLRPVLRILDQHTIVAAAAA